MPADRNPAARAATRPATTPAADQTALRDHEAIGRLADDVLPALIARLASSGLGEIEVRQGEWKARLRKPVGPIDGRVVAARVAAEAPAAHGSLDGRSNSGRAGSPADDFRRTRGPDAEELHRAVATSPAVGIYHPCRELTVGMRVRAGDRIGDVDVLGVRQDVVAPVAGVIGSSLAEAGEAVEYGQELVRIELAENGPDLEGLADLQTPGVGGEA
jgi:biotin carboxyl carrier protein